jgi:hypothetical protein
LISKLLAETETESEKFLWNFILVLLFALEGFNAEFPVIRI